MAERWGGMQGMQVAAEPLSAPPYATECAMTLDGTAERKNARFSVIPARTGSVVLLGHFLMAWTVPPSFVEIGPKLRVGTPLS